jgi:CRISPR-associated protein Cas1
MLRRILEVAGDDQYLSVDRGFLVVRKGDEVRGRIPLDDIGALIGNAHGLVYSGNALTALATRGTPTVVCGRNHNPVAIVWPVEQHYEQAARIGAQLAATLPTAKRLWKQIVQRKIREQAALLRLLGKTYLQMNRLASRVKPGDPSNLEAQAAKHYWRNLFGKQFRRDPDLDGPNSMLNYGYAVLRSAVCRAVVSSGFHPSIGLFHRDPRNTFQLVDDLMEPFRPSIDAVVHSLWARGVQELDADSKRTLVLALYRTRRMNGNSVPLARCIDLSVMSLVAPFGDPKALIEFPDLMEKDFLDGDKEQEIIEGEAAA